MKLFFCIPDAPFVSILMDWLSWRDLGHLDSALCNRKLRAEVHLLIATSRHAFADPWNGKINVEWMISRGIRCSVVQVPRYFIVESYLSLQERFLMHSGSFVQTLRIELILSTCNDDLKCGFRNLLRGLSTHCTSLKQIKIATSLAARERFTLSNDDFSLLHTVLLTLQPTLQHLTLRGFANVPLSLLQYGIIKLQTLSIEHCIILEDVPLAIQLTSAHRLASIKSIHTKLPPIMCALVTDVATNILYNGSGAKMSFKMSDYTNLVHATAIHMSSSFDSHTIPDICAHWCKLVVLRFDESRVSEENTLQLIGNLTCLQILDAANSQKVYTPKHSSGAGLHTLCMYCEKGSTLRRVLQRCPNLVTLSLVQPESYPWQVPVEKSLYLLRDTTIRALYLTDYSFLCAEDVADLQDLQLHTLSITNAGRHLMDKAVLQLIPRLRSLHTLALTNCTELSYKLVMQVPPLCPTLRTYKYQTRTGKDSQSNLILMDLLPTIFPHVKTFIVHC